MYRHIRKIETPKLTLQVQVLGDGALYITADVPPHLRDKIGCALTNSLQKKYFKQGRLEILFDCLRIAEPTEKARLLREFCERFSRRSGVVITAKL